MEAPSTRQIVLVSDGTGETALQMIKAALVQFEDPQNLNFVRYKNIRTESQIQAICDASQKAGALIVYTLVSPDLRSYLQDESRRNSVPTIDLLGPLLIGLANHLGFEPRSQAGLLHVVDEKYFKRIEAMEYTIAHDDGRDLTQLDRADLVVLGISRTSKTPLSLYFSHHGWKVANIPLIQGFEVPKEILEIDQKKVVGLTINPEELATIRRNRLEKLGHERGGDYADLEKITLEVDFANQIFKKNRRWAIFDVTSKALEETASEITRLMASRRLIPPFALENLISTTLAPG